MPVETVVHGQCSCMTTTLQNVDEQLLQRKKERENALCKTILSTPYRRGTCGAAMYNVIDASVSKQSGE